MEKLDRGQSGGTFSFEHGVRHPAGTPDA